MSRTVNYKDQDDDGPYLDKVEPAQAARLTPDDPNLAASDEGADVDHEKFIGDFLPDEEAAT